MTKQLFMAFVPVFVAVDAIGIMPVFLSLTQGMDKQQISRVIHQSVWTGISLAIVFIFIGKMLFKLLGITIGDFMVAGGAILFCIAILDLLSPGKRSRLTSSELGVVPLGTPLIVGPAVLTTCLIIIDQYGLMPTIISVSANVILAGILFYFSGLVVKIIGKSGTVALSKIMALLLAAIAVMMIRKGIMHLIHG